MSKKVKKILWVDDEIELLKPHIYFLEEKGYQVLTATNSEDAVSIIERENFDILLLDEMMPGRDGLSTLEQIKEMNPAVPIVMITKSEEEELMNEAIGKKIDDYLTKPVNPSQILSVCKRILEKKEIRQQQISKDYAMWFNQVMSVKSSIQTFDEWVELYTQLTKWELDLDSFQDSGLQGSHNELRNECNIEFGNFIKANYKDWVNYSSSNRPTLSTDLMSKYVFPHFANKDERQLYFIIIDCLRLDQWLTLEPLLYEYFDIKRNFCCSILPTATPYSRNSIFSGLFPRDIAKMYPQYWQETPTAEHTKNKFERELLNEQLRRLQIKLPSGFRYQRVFNTQEAKELRKNLPSFSSSFISIVFNFIDILTHGRSESEILQSIAPGESGFRSLTKSWFFHSELYDIMKYLSTRNCVIILTSDHGWILSTKPTKAVGNKETSTSLRYKFGNNIGCEPREAWKIEEPEVYGLPQDTVSKQYIFAMQNYYFVYPTNYHFYQKQYEGTFQHGGVSLEEMILPCVILNSK